MRRDLEALESDAYDLAIVGGGVYGACAAREAALQGLSVCLIERGDFGCATSAGSLKIVHGGLRYLQNLDLKRMRESIGERRALGRIAPHLVWPMPFAIPCYGHFLRGREAMAAALIMNEVVSWDRNRGLIAERRIPRGRLLSKAVLESMIPNLPEPGLVGGAIWYDAQARNTERLLIGFLKAAAASGARLANYVEASGFIQEGPEVTGVEAIDRLAGRSLRIRAKIVLNAAGPWVDTLLGRLSGARPERHFHMSKGMNLVTRKILDGDFGAAIPYQETYVDKQAVLDKGKLHFFVVPWKQYSLIGTRHLPWQGEPDSFRVTEEDIERFLGEINRSYPTAGLRREDVVHVYEGMLPALVDAGGTDDVQIGKQYTITDHAESDGVNGLVTMVGVKWTTARDVAERATGVVLRKLRRGTRCDSSEIPIPGGDFSDWSDLVERLVAAADGGIDRAIVERLAESYGTEAGAVIREAQASDGGTRVLEGGSPTLVAEIRYAAREEMAQHLADVVLRRTELAIAGHPGDAVVEEAARVAGVELGWSAERQRREAEAVAASLKRESPAWAALAD